MKKLKDAIRKHSIAKGKMPEIDESHNALIKLADKMLQEVTKNPEHQALNNFSLRTKIPISYIRRYARENTYFAKAYELAKTAISVALAYQWAEDKISDQLANRLMEIYNDEWRELLREKYQAKKEMDKEDAKIEVIEIPKWKMTKSYKKEAKA
jgi:hypothetical protein